VASLLLDVHRAWGTHQNGFVWQAGITAAGTLPDAIMSYPSLPRLPLLTLPATVFLGGGGIVAPCTGSLTTRLASPTRTGTDGQRPLLVTTANPTSSRGCCPVLLCKSTQHSTSKQGRPPLCGPAQRGAALLANVSSLVLPLSTTQHFC
jgi:hypothetical protein